MALPPPPPTGFTGSLRALGDSLLASLQDRLALFSLELQEEKFRLIQTFVWISAAIFTGMLVVGFASLTLVYCVPASARAVVLAGLTLSYAGTMVALILRLRRFLARQPRPFDATLQELGEDRACIPDQNLTRLALLKVFLRIRITRRRAECAGYARDVLQPLEFLDRLLDLGRRIAPLAKLTLVPLGWLLARTAPRRGLLDSLLRWGPLAFGLLRRVAKIGRQ